MKLSRILKNRKAMTPVMIGIIVAASVVAVLFIVMAAVVPSMNKEVSMQIRDRSVKGNSTVNDLALKFNVMCDYAPGEVWRVEIFKDGGQIGYQNTPSEEPFAKNEERTMIITAFVFTGTNSSDDSGGVVLFHENEDYVLKVFFRPVDSDITNLFTEHAFSYEGAD